MFASAITDFCICCKFLSNYVCLKMLVSFSHLYSTFISSVTTHIFISSNIYAYYFFFFTFYTGSNFFYNVENKWSEKVCCLIPGLWGKGFNILQSTIWIAIEFFVDRLYKIMVFPTVPDLLIYFIITWFLSPFLLMYWITLTFRYKLCFHPNNKSCFNLLSFFFIARLAVVFICYGCHNKVPETRWHNRNLLSPSFGDWKCEIKVYAGVILS